MTWTWDPSVLSSSNLQQVRLEIGDTNDAYELLQDESIEYRLTEYSDNIGKATIACITDILAKLAQDIDRSNVGMNATRSQRIVHYTDLLKVKKAKYGSIVYAKLRGVSKDEQETQDDDDDYKQNQYRIGMDDKDRIG